MVDREPRGCTLARTRRTRGAVSLPKAYSSEEEKESEREKNKGHEERGRVPEEVSTQDRSLSHGFFGVHSLTIKES